MQPFIIIRSDNICNLFFQRKLYILAFMVYIHLPPSDKNRYALLKSEKKKSPRLQYKNPISCLLLPEESPIFVRMLIVDMIVQLR